MEISRHALKGLSEVHIASAHLAAEPLQDRLKNLQQRFFLQASALSAGKDAFSSERLMAFVELSDF